jgi:hypothetical protein
MHGRRGHSADGSCQQRCGGAREKPNLQRSFGAHVAQICQIHHPTILLSESLKRVIFSQAILLKELKIRVVVEVNSYPSATYIFAPKVLQNCHTWRLD